MAAVAKVTRSSDTIIVGGGVVGICTGLYLQRTGRKVVVIERRSPGDGASGHNGGIVSVGDCAPIATPGIVWAVPRMLRDPLSPMAIHWPYLPRLTSWLVRFLLAGRRSEVDRIARGQASLMSAAVPAYQKLLADTEAMQWMKPGGLLYGYMTDASFDNARFGVDLRRRQGTPFTLVDDADITGLDPLLSGRFRHGIYLPDAQYTLDPGEFTRALARIFRAEGGALETTTVTGFETSAGRVQAVQTKSGQYSTGEVVLAAGAWSRRLARELGVRVPLDTERGYGIQLPQVRFRPRVPIISGDYHIAISPDVQGIRVVGTAEFGGLRAPAKMERAERLSKAVAQIFPEFDLKASAWWMSYRPSMPDSLPVIGRAPRYENAYLAFGHGHRGFGQAAITGLLIQELVSGACPSMDLHFYRPDRFRFSL